MYYDYSTFDYVENVCGTDGFIYRTECHWSLFGTLWIVSGLCVLLWKVGIENVNNGLRLFYILLCGIRMWNIWVCVPNWISILVPPGNTVNVKCIVFGCISTWCFKAILCLKWKWLEYQRCISNSWRIIQKFTANDDMSNFWIDCLIFWIISGLCSWLQKVGIEHVSHWLGLLGYRLRVGNTWIPTLITPDYTVILFKQVLWWQSLHYISESICGTVAFRSEWWHLWLLKHEW